MHGILKEINQKNQTSIPITNCLEYFLKFYLKLFVNNKNRIIFATA